MGESGQATFESVAVELEGRAKTAHDRSAEARSNGEQLARQYEYGLFQALREAAALLRERAPAADELVAVEKRWCIEGDYGVPLTHPVEARIISLDHEVVSLRKGASAQSARIVELEEALGRLVYAMNKWGAEEDGVPEDGEVGAAYDWAHAVLRWPLVPRSEGVVPAQQAPRGSPTAKAR